MMAGTSILVADTLAYRHMGENMGEVELTRVLDGGLEVW